MKFTPTPIPIIFNAMKKTIFHTLLLAAALLLNTACHRSDIRTQTFEIEQLRSPEAMQLIVNALKPLPGIQTVTPDYTARTLAIVFNGRELYLKNIEYAIVNAGFSLPHWPATEAEKEKLPESLR